MHKILLVWLLALGAVACKDYNIKIDQDMRAEAQQMPVKGRQGNMLNQKVRYGEFHTDRVKRGWVKRYNIPFFLRFEGASEKLSFTQFNEQGTAAEVFAISKFSNKEIPVLGEFFGIPIDYKFYFAGTIYLPATGQHYDFVVYNPEANTRFRRTHGFIKGPGLEADIQGITQLDDRKVWNLDNLGFEFLQDNKSVGAVQVFNAGKVWIRKGLSEEHRLALAALSTSLMIRSDDISNSMNVTF